MVAQMKYDANMVQILMDNGFFRRDGCMPIHNHTLRYGIIRLFRVCFGSKP